MGKEKIVDPFPALGLPGLQNGEPHRREWDHPIFEPFALMDVELPGALNLNHVRGFQSSQFSGANTGME